EDMPSFSDGWIAKLKKRLGVKSRKMYGKSCSAPKDTKEINLRVEEIKKKLRMYKRKDIFNFDKTGLFYKQPPVSTILTAAISGRKTNKVQLTVTLICNSNGFWKLKPFIIDKYAKPCCFGKKNGKLLHYLYYYHNDKSWMTGAIFRYICKIINRRARNLGRKILVLLDNAACHNTYDNYTNVEFLYLPPNTTSYLQPLDASIIQNFKVKYQYYQYILATQRYISNMVINSDGYFKLSQLEGMNFIKLAWNQVTPETITNCFKHTRLFDD
ncbi:Homeodomain-like DNA binding domain-containing transcription factor, partial [Phycomyces blakesleeanus NRRL 1555(-)]